MQTLLLPSHRKPCILLRMAPLRMLYITTLTYIFKVTNFDMWISGKRWEIAKMLKYDFYWLWYLPSNGTSANVILRDRDLNFRVHIWNVNIWEMERAIAKMCHDFCQDWSSPSTGEIENIVLRELDLHFQGHSCYAVAIKNSQVSDVLGRFTSTSTSPAVNLLLLYICRHHVCPTTSIIVCEYG